VDVTLVAFDKKGRPVTDLKANELQVEDNGRPQEVRFFGQAAGSGPATVSAAGPATNVTGTEAAPVYNNRTVAAPSAEGNSTVLLIDASHVAFGDLNYAREEMLRFLQKTPADERMGLYVLRSTGFDVLREPDTDRERLVATLKAWMPSAQDLQRAQDEEQRNRQQIEYVHNVPDLASVNGNGQGGNDPEMYTSGKSVAAAAAYPPDAALRPLGDRPEEAVLYLLVGVGRHLAAIRGHKMLVWVSSDNVLADFGSQTVGREDTGNKFLDPASLRAREALNEAHVSIYPLDVSQLEVGGTGADIGTHNVLVVGHSDRDKANSVVGDAGGGMSPGRDTARMQEDTHPIQGAFRDLAAATGGRAFRRSGDIANELDSVVADGRAAYLLSFSPDGPADDKYHTLRVKTMRAGVTLRYRTGYQYSKEPATLKERFRKAVWEAGDGTEIGLTATMAGKDLDVRIAGSDLALAEQGGRWTGTVDVFVVTREKGGLHASATGQRMGLKLKASTYAESVKEGIPVREPLSGTGTADSVRVIVVDEGSGRMGWITLQPTADGRQ
jgi:VWFA-related protein